MIRSTIFAVLLCSFATISSGNEPTTDARESGQLSYTLFNLTGEAWVVTPYGPQGNPHAYTDLAYTWGWQGGESKSVEKTTNPPNIFNYYPFDTPKNDDCRLENPNQFTWVKDSYIFFNEQADPLYYKTGYSDCNSDSPSQFFEGTETIKKGIEGRFCSKSGHWLLDDGSGKIQGRPAVADSFWLAPAGFSDRGILFSSLASSANMFYSFQQGSYKSRWEDANYPQCVSRTGHFPNEEINPLAPDPEYRALGSGMVNADFAINLNSIDTNTKGGIWFGAETINPDSDYLATGSLNHAMLPINLSAYTNTDSYNNADYLPEFNFSQLQWWGYRYSPSYGAHYTLAIGDPFLVSSFAAKTLWYLATNPNFAFQNDATTEANLKAMKRILVPTDSAVKGVFNPNTRAEDYVEWLLKSPKQAQVALKQTTDAAAAGWNKNKSLWGKVLATSYRIGLAYAVPTISGTWKDYQKTNKSSSANIVTGIVGVSNFGLQKIPSLFSTTECSTGTCQTVAVDANAPQSELAQPSYNATYSTSSLLGSLLANVILQAEIANNSDELNVDSMLPLFANYRINYEPWRCVWDSNRTALIDVESNLVSGPCWKNDNIPNPCNGCETVENGGPGSPQDYTNVLSTAANSQSTSKINLWSAILNGAEITTEESAMSEAFGYMKLSNPGTSAFSPPTMILDLPNFDGEYVNKTISAVNVAFAQDTGLLAVSSYTVNGNLADGVSVTAPSETPNLSLDVDENEQPQTGYGIDLGIPELDSGYEYDALTGIMTVSSYQGTDSTMQGMWKSYPLINDTQTIDMKTCEEDSDVVLHLNADTSQTTAAGASGTLYCIRDVPVEASQPAPASTPELVMVVTSSTQSTIHGPFNPEYDAGTGQLSIPGYSYGDSRSSNFENGLQTIDMTQCALDSAVTVTITPIATDGKQAYGFLSCQSPASLPYAACTSDPGASGGVVVAIIQAPDEQGNGASFELACTCLPEYLNGSSSPYLLGGVAVGATSEGSSPNPGTNTDTPGPGRTCKET